MVGEMCWMSPDDDFDKKLYIRTDSSKEWVLYSELSELSVPDYKITGGSLGYATMQKLLKEGWKLVTS